MKFLIIALATVSGGTAEQEVKRIGPMPAIRCAQIVGQGINFLTDRPAAYRGVAGLRVYCGR